MLCLNTISVLLQLPTQLSIRGVVMHFCESLLLHGDCFYFKLNTRWVLPILVIHVQLLPSFTQLYLGIPQFIASWYIISSYISVYYNIILFYLQKSC